MIELAILGTAAGIPTKERGHPAIALKREGDLFLFDCGENTQRQAKIAGISLLKIRAIFITHWHIDHFAGIIGLIQSMALLERKAPLYIYGPKPAKEIIDILLGLERKAHITGTAELGYDLVTKEIESGIIYDSDSFFIEAIPSLHAIPGFSYKFQEKDKPGKFNLAKAKKLGLKPVQFGQLQRGEIVKVNDNAIKPTDVMGVPRSGLKIIYSGDTGYNEKLIKFSENADLLIHEATFSSEMAEYAHAVGHVIASEAAEIAKKAKVKKLLLLHISARYKDAKPILAEAKKVFKNTEVAKDFMKIILK